VPALDAPKVIDKPGADGVHAFPFIALADWASGIVHIKSTLPYGAASDGQNDPEAPVGENLIRLCIAETILFPT
jgi:hypothetical protein